MGSPGSSLLTDISRFLDCALLFSDSCSSAPSDWLPWWLSAGPSHLPVLAKVPDNLIIYLQELLIACPLINTRDQSRVQEIRTQPNGVGKIPCFMDF